MQTGLDQDNMNYRSESDGHVCSEPSESVILRCFRKIFHIDRDVQVDDLVHIIFINVFCRAVQRSKRLHFFSDDMMVCCWDICVF